MDRPTVWLAIDHLLASMSRLLVTEQDASNIPLVPSPNPGDWRYTAAIDNIKTSGTPYSPYSLLDHLRHLLSEEPTLKSHRLHGGVITWLQHDISKLVVWSISARDDWQSDGNTDPGQIRRQLIRILFELYGDSHALLELPANTAYAGLVDMPAAKIALLPFGPLQNQFSIVDDLDFHLQGVAASPGVSPAQQKAAANISVVINQLNTWLGRVLHDDRLRARRRSTSVRARSRDRSKVAMVCVWHSSSPARDGPHVSVPLVEKRRVLYSGKGLVLA
jgi:hypothetical protein